MNLAERLLKDPSLIEGVHYEIADGRIFPIVRGGATGDDDGDDGDDDDSQNDDDGSDDGDDDGEGDDDEDDEDEQKFSQKDVNRIMAKEKKDGRRAGRKAILEELGFSSVEDAKKKIAAAAKSKPRAKDGDDDDTDNSSSEPEVDRTLSRLEARAERLLIRAGAPDDDRTLKGLIVMLDLDSSMDEEDVTSAVEDLKEERSALFDTTDKKAPKSKPRPSDPGSGRRKTQVKSPDAAKSLMERRHGKPAGASGK